MTPSSVLILRLTSSPVGHREQNPERRGRGHAAKHPQHAAPAERRQRGRDRHGGQHAAQAADGDRDPGDEGDLRRREPLRVGLDDGHQAGGDADADDHARDDQRRKALGEREQRESRGRDQAQRGLHVARADPVERHAARQLRHRVGSEHAGGEHPELARRQRELHRQHRPDDRHHRARRLVDQPEDRKRQRDAGEQAFRIRINPHETHRRAPSSPRPRHGRGLRLGAEHGDPRRHFPSPAWWRSIRKAASG